MTRIFVTGIGTDVGKSVACAIMVQALGSDYWKPIQSGSNDGTDTQFIQDLVINPDCFFHPEAYCFKEAVSPHFAAELENKSIDFKNITTPKTKKKFLIVEGAGGLFVPLDQMHFMIDLILPNDLVILVSLHYVGSINHTLLSIHELKKRNLNFGLLFIGEENSSTEKILSENAPIIGRIPILEKINSQSISRQALLFKNDLYAFLAKISEETLAFSDKIT